MSKELDEMLGEHQSKFKVKSWKNYTDEELRWWITLLRKRAEHRSDKDKRDKDLKDASNYTLMLNESLKYNTTDELFTIDIKIDKSGKSYQTVKLFDWDIYRVFRDVDRKILKIILSKDNIFKEFVLKDD